MAAAGLVSCDITPVEGVTVSVRGGSPTNFEVEWRDMRCLPTSSDADVSRNATPRAFVDSAPSVLGLVAILHKIVFGEVLDDTGSKDTMTTVLPNTVAAGGSIVICLQRRRDRACLRRLSLTTDSTTGELQTVFCLFCDRMHACWLVHCCVRKSVCIYACMYVLARV